ncbi:MAG: protein-L-isoaspartate(D-aspartate) O-methyltransferase [Ignavibacteria bacterium]|nr:protein-L-isoaspartate(D-aspartate) O-methyltransferase [Ignavibacteria bacterium]
MEERNKLIVSLRRKGIKDERVLTAIQKVPREIFVPDDQKEKAYIDNALPIECGQSISQPYTVAYMTELLDTFEGCKVLEIGTGSGYQCAILQILGCIVYSIERIEFLHNKVKKIFASLNIQANLFLGDGSKGLPEFAPFDRIIVTAAAPDIPSCLINQLEIGGKLVIPVGSRSEQIMTLVIRSSLSQYEIIRKDSFRFVPLIGEEGWSNE